MKKQKSNKLSTDRGSSSRRANPYKSSVDQTNSPNGGGLNELAPDGGNDNLKAPKNIISSESQARIFVDNLKQDHSARFGEFGKIQKSFWGHRPRDPAKLKEKGLDYLSNVNNGHFRIHINKYLSSEYNLIHGVASPVKIEIRAIDTYTDYKISRAMEKAYKEVYGGWEDYYTHLDAMREDRCLFAIGVTLREFNAKGSKTSWKFTAISPDQFLYPLKTRITENSLSKFAVVHTMSAQELWDIYNDLEKDDEEPWNKKALGYILWRVSSQYSTDTNKAKNWGSTLLEMQRSIRNYQKSVGSYYNDDVKLVSVYTKEWNSKWSQTIIDETNPTDAPLYFKSDRYDKVSDFVQIWAFEPNKKTYGEVRGLGYRIFQPVEVQNRLDNTLIDQAHLASTVLIRSRAGRGRDAKSVKINLGAINDIGEGEFVQQFQAANIEQAIAVNQYQGQILERNAQYEGMNLDEPDNKTKTLGQVGMEATRDAVLTKPQVSFFYRQLDVFIRNTFRLIWELGDADPFFEEFKEEVMFELRNDKIPGQFLEALFKMPTKKEEKNRFGLPKFLKVKAARSTSSGSQVADILSVNRMFQLAQFMGTDERYTFLQMATAAYSDHDNVDLFFPDKNRPQVFTEPMQKAIIENAILSELGKEIPVSPNDAHEQEAPIHITGCQEVIKAWREGGDVILAYNQLKNLYPHFLAHFTMLAENPMHKALFESLGPLRGEVENQFKQIEANANAAMAAEQKREQERRLEEAKEQLRLNPNSPENLQILVDHELAVREQNLKEARAMKADNLQAIKATVKSNVETALMVKGFQNEQRRKNIKLVSDIQKDRAEINATKTNDSKTS